MFIATDLYSTFWSLETEKAGDLKLVIWLVTLAKKMVIRMDGPPNDNVNP